MDMLEAKYYKDYRHNYMILQCGQRDLARSYQYRILTSDKIREILRCCVRHVNGITYYYYDISSKTTLESLYKGKKMSYEQVRDMLRQIYAICDRLAGYFMDETKLVLLPEHIYYDFTDDKYIGLYYPDYQAVGAEAVKPLMDFLLEHIDTEDVGLTEDMYRIYEMAEEPHFIMEDALQILEEREEQARDAVVTAAVSDLTKGMKMQEESGTGYREHEMAGKKFREANGDQDAPRMQNGSAWQNKDGFRNKEASHVQKCMSGRDQEASWGQDGEESCNRKREWDQDYAAYGSSCGESAAQWETDAQTGCAFVESQKDRESFAKKRLFYLVFSVLSLLGTGGALAVYNTYDLIREEKLALYGAMAAMGICFFICVARILSCRQDKRKDKQKGCQERTADPEWDAGQEYCGEDKRIPLDQVISYDMNLDPEESDLPMNRTGHYDSERPSGNRSEYRGSMTEYGTDRRSSADRPGDMSGRNYGRNNVGRHLPVDAVREEDNYGNTVFFDESMVEEGKLYAIDQRNKKHIELRHFPYTIGKAAGCVDYVLPDRSVSRLHARFDRDGEKLLLTDLNSTNGTYKNGLRMQPRETVEIEPGDEIRFGNLNYCYR